MVETSSFNGGVLITYSRLLLLSDHHYVYLFCHARVSRHCCLHVLMYCVTAHTVIIV